MAGIDFEEVTKVFPDGTKAVDRLTLDIPDGGFTVLVGPSGSGKSTALRMVAGLRGRQRGQRPRYRRSPRQRHPAQGPRTYAMVFQSYALYPHMDVARNMGLRAGDAGPG